MWVQWGQPKKQDPCSRPVFLTFFCPWLLFISKFISQKGHGGHGVLTRVLMSKGLSAGVSGKSCLCSWTAQALSISPFCKTQNSGLRSKEEKPRDPISQPSRCNTQEGLLSVVQTGDSDLLGGRAPRTANWASFL